MKPFGAFGPVMGLSAVCGPILAGWLVDADYFGSGWRMIFFINVPLGVLAIAGALRFMPESGRTGASRLDVPGTAMIVAASLLLIYPLVQGRELGWPLWTFLAMGASVPVFAALFLFILLSNWSGLFPFVGRVPALRAPTAAPSAPPRIAP